MEKVVLNELKEDSLFHFTHEDNIEDISVNGLKPSIGENAFGIEKSPKIFFSKGELGIMKVTEVWLRWLMNRIYGPSDRLGMFRDETPEERNQRMSEWVKEFLSGEYKNDEEKKGKLFEYFYQYLEERKYLVLDIEDKKEYDSSDIDESKESLENQGHISNMFAEIMYCEFSDMNTKVMDDWNMHTKKNIAIDKSKIKKVETKDHRDDMLSIVMEIYDKYKDIPHEKFLLDDFITYAKKENLMKMVNEGVKDDKNNNGRKY